MPGCDVYTHTGEHLDVIYRRGSAYDPEALKKLDVFLRDSRTGDVHAFDPRLFDLLSDLTAAAGEPDGEIDVICGYPTPVTNEYLAHAHNRRRQEQPAYASRGHRYPLARRQDFAPAGAGASVGPRRRRLLSGNRFYPCGRGPGAPLVNFQNPYLTASCMILAGPALVICPNSGLFIARIGGTEIHMIQGVLRFDAELQWSGAPGCGTAGTDPR